ncbi:MAG: mannose-ethanolamine phosphotransferase gpi13 [Chrysothrix sp. TS-e1954]|nr:MAG: mannose-ethanolamine phosphotransferase gpi13 [Chrysothrix sp. TS-e1954]
MENGDPKGRTRKEILEEISTSRARKKEDETLKREKSAGTEQVTQSKRAEFKAKHGLLIAFLTLILFIHIIGIYLFTSGFLLTRLVLEPKSQCGVPPVPLHNSYIPGSQDGCWHPRTFKKAVVLVIDALRYDFTVPFVAGSYDETPHQYHNGIRVLYETAVSDPQNAFLLPFIADPPTTTLQRLKGLTTGTLPTFIDAGSSFAGTAIDEDNLIAQLLTAGRNVVHLGDDTWHSLFPGYFDANLTKAYDSFNVWDLHTVDNGVIEHLMPLLHPSNSSKWDVLFGHFLGVDHAGHRYGPDHSAMKGKLEQMDAVLHDAISLLDEETLLVVMGDHGMDGKGDHGGESDDEVEAALWMYSKAGVFGRGSAESIKPPPNAKVRPVNQIDLVPTLALLLGLPVPFNNLGAPIEEAFIGSAGKAWENLATVQRLTAAQVHGYQREYALARKPDPLALSGPTRLWESATHSWNQTVLNSKLPAQQWQDLARGFSDYQQSNLQMCKDLWARFDLVSMGQGVTVLIWPLAVLIVYIAIEGITVELNAVLFLRGVVGLLAGAAFGFASAFVVPQLGLLRNTLFAAAVVCCGSLTFTLLAVRQRFSSVIPSSLWSVTCVLAALLLSIGFASNSFTIWEDEILLHLLATFGVLSCAGCFRLRSRSDRNQALIQCSIFLVCIRLASLARLCREEQMPYCRSTYYASVNSSTSAPWQLAIPYLIATALPSMVKYYYTNTLSWHGSAPFWIGIAFRGTLLLIAVFWTLDAADNGDWFNIDSDLLKTIRTYLAQLVLAIAAGAGGATFGWQAPHIAVQSIDPQSTQPSEQPAPSKAHSSSKHTKSNGNPTSPTPTSNLTQPTAPRMLIHGASNLYGTHFTLLTHSVLLLPLLLLQKPMGQATLALTSIAILALFEIIHLLQRQPASSPAASSTLSTVLAPTILALLGHFAFFKTGHQATLASIQWDAAFVPLKTLNYLWGPLFMILNTFAGQIFTAASVPLCVLWRRPYRFASSHASEGDVSVLGPATKTTASNDETELAEQRHDPRTLARHALLTDVSKAYMVHILVYATINLATTLWAAHLRRHLMLYRVFMPRWLLGLAGMVFAEIVGIVVGIYGVGWSVGSVAGVFGW